MHQLPEPPRFAERVSRPRDWSPWADGIVFFAVLAAGVLIAIFGHETAASVAATWVALGGLYRVWKRPPSSADTLPPDDHAGDGEERTD
jgi:hypothetical protein